VSYDQNAVNTTKLKNSIASLIASLIDRSADTAYGSFQPARQPGMSKENTLVAKLTRDGTLVEVLPDGTTRLLPDRTGWARIDAMTDEEVHAAARADPGARPMTPGEMAKARRAPRVKTLRRVLGLTQEEFAARYRIPIGTLRDWEQGRTEPDQSARAYIKVIASDPDWVSRALDRGSEERRPAPEP
jgi:putative transcriptional regulator